MTWEMDPGFAEWFFQELMDGGALALDGRPDGRAVSAARALMKRAPRDVGVALRMGMYVATAAIRRIEAGLPDQDLSALELEREIVDALEQAVKATRSQRRRRRR